MACSTVAERPKIQQCIIGSDALICFDPREPEENQSKKINFSDAINFYCTNPADRVTEIEYFQRSGK